MRAPSTISAVLIALLLLIGGADLAAAQSAPPTVQPEIGGYQRPPLHREPWHTRLFFGWGYSGFTTVLSGQGPFGHMKPGFTVAAWVGLRFAPHWAAEVGFSGSTHANGTGSLVFEGGASLVGAGLTLKYFLVPRWRVFVPFLLAGVLFHGFSVISSGETGDSLSLNAIGGGYHAGLGFDIYILPWLTLGVRARYRAVFLGKPACDVFDAPCDEPVYQVVSTIRAVTGELTLQLVF